MAEVRVSEQPAALPAGSRVIVMVSSGRPAVASIAYVDVPGVLGLAQGAALSALQDTGLQARVYNDYSDSVARGRVMGQMPGQGATASSGSEVVLLVSSGAAATRNPDVALPDVVGMSEPEAVARIQAAGLSPQVARESSRTVPAGVVMSQLPDRSWVAIQPARRPNWWIWAASAAGLLLLMVAAFLLFSRGATAAVPQVVGQAQTSAERELADAGFITATETAQAETDAPVGTVIEQVPVAGTKVKRGSRVVIRVLAGTQALRVPNVVGLARDAATSRLRQSGFEVGVVEQRTAIAPAGTVFEQRPSPGAEAEPGSRVTIVVSRAVQAAQVSVPDVVGLVQADAEATLDEAGLRILVVENPSQEVAEGVVALQFPEQGDEVQPGATIALMVSSGPPEDSTTVAVPDVVGDERLDAQEVLANEGFSSQLVPVAGTTETANDVISQLPDPGTAVSPGSTVVLFYAR